MTRLQSYRIGDIARLTGVSVETLRYYEKRRLLAVPPRTQGGFRMYSEDTIHRVAFIKQAQSLGLTLDDVQRLLAGRLRHEPAVTCRKVFDLLTVRVEDIEARIKDLQVLRRTLQDHLLTCERALSDTTNPECPTIEALDDATRTKSGYEAR